ncbi:MAG: hypothetical protein AAF318_08860 [Pseudomonadota bacterium]
MSRPLFTLFFALCGLPSAAVIAYFGTGLIVGAAREVLARPNDSEAWSALFVLPGLPAGLGLFAIVIFAVRGAVYIVRGAPSLAGRTGQLVTALLLSAVPLLFTLPLGALTIARESNPWLLALATLGSGIFPLVGTLALLWLARRPLESGASTDRSV